MYEIETADIYDAFSENKEVSDYGIYFAKLKYYNDSNALVVGKMNNEINGDAVEKFVRLKRKVSLILVSSSSKY